MTCRLGKNLAQRTLDAGALQVTRIRARRSLSEHEREAAPPSLLDRAAWRFLGFCAGVASFYRWMRVR